MDVSRVVYVRTLQTQQQLLLRPQLNQPVDGNAVHTILVHGLVKESCHAVMLQMSGPSSEPLNLSARRYAAIFQRVTMRIGIPVAHVTYTEPMARLATAVDVGPDKAGIHVVDKMLRSAQVVTSRLVRWTVTMTLAGTVWLVRHQSS